MKYVNLMKLLSALLCAVMLLSACSAPAEDPVNTQDTTNGTEESTAPQSTVLDPVDPILENFFVSSGENEAILLGAAERLDGEYYDSTVDGAITVFKKSDIDFLNVQTDTYTVFNTKLEKTVLTLTNSYTRGKYADFDWDDIYINDYITNSEGEEEIPLYPESIMEVHPVYVDNYSGLYLIEVRRAVITPIDEEIIEENEGDFYTVETVYEYYDAAGTKLAECRESQSYDGCVESFELESGTVLVTLDTTIAYFDLVEGVVFNVINADGEPVRFGYTAETADYGYCLGSTMGALGMDYSEYIEVYSKKDGVCVLRFYLDACDSYTWAPLANGNVFIQYLNLVEENSGLAYDVDMFGFLMTIDTVIVQVPTGVVVPVETDYVVNEMWNRDTFLRLAKEERYLLTATENAPNIAVAAKIENKRVDPYATQLVVFNNDASVMYAMDKIIPEQRVGLGGMDLFGYAVLPTGDYLVELDTTSKYSYAIATKDGKVRSYLDTVNDTPYIAGEFIVLSDGVYDYDMNLVLKFEAEEAEDTLTFELVIGDHILVSKEVENEETEELERLFFELKKDENGALVLSEALFEGEVMMLTDSSEDYFILQNVETEKYTMYNTELAHVLTTANYMSVTKCDEAYLAVTNLDTNEGVVTLYYTIGQ